MTFFDVLEDDIFKFPLDSSEFFPDKLSTILHKYLEIIKSIDDEYGDIIKKELPQIEHTVLELLAITQSVFMGNSSEAYSRFSLLIEKLEPHLTNPDKNVVFQNPSHLFKARKEMEGQFQLENMFHVPFEKRYDINSSRFSLSGVPCLYLSNSIYTCWEELDRPVFLQMAVSRFEITGKNFMFLDLSDRAKKIKTLMNFNLKGAEKVIPDHDKLILGHKKLLKEFVLPRFIKTYPLLAACYIRVHHKKSHFIPEYTFPQMVMQWIMTQENIDGIKYISTKSDSTEMNLHNLEDFLNFAIPVRSFQQKGYCKIMAKNLNLTEPLTFELLSILDPVKATTRVDFDEAVKNKLPVPPIFFITLNSNKACQYLNTTFGILEHELFNKPIYNLLELN